MGTLIRFYEGSQEVVDMLSNDEKKQRRRPISPAHFADIALGDGVSLLIEAKINDDMHAGSRNVA